MATLALPQDIIDLGFTPEQFSDPLNFATTWLQNILTEAEDEIIDVVGGASAFAGFTADTNKKSLLTRAEKWLVSAELWSRRRIALESQQIGAQDNREAFYMSKSYGDSAADAEDKAWALIMRATGVSRGDSSVASGYTESGRFEPAEVED